MHQIVFVGLIWPKATAKIERDPVEIAVVVEIIFERNSSMGCNSYFITVLIIAFLEH